MLINHTKDAESPYRKLALLRGYCIAPTCAICVRDSYLLVSYRVPPFRLACRKQMMGHADTL